MITTNPSKPPSIILYTDQQLTMFKCAVASGSGIGVDRTFNLSSCYLTPICFQNPWIGPTRGWAVEVQLGGCPLRDRGTSRVSATRACGLFVHRPVPLFSLKPVPSPHLVGLSRVAPQPVAGGRWEEDSQVRRESPDAMDSHMHLDRSLRRLRLDPSIGIQELLARRPRPAPKQEINLVGGGGGGGGVGLLRPQNVA